MSLKKEDLERALAEKRLMLSEDINWTNDKMIKALGDYTLSHSKEGKYSWSARYVQALETVQLAEHLKKFKKAFDKAKIDPMTSPDYVAEFKENGARVVIAYDPALGFEFFSRRESKGTFLNGNFTDNILLIKDGIIAYPKDFKNKFDYRFILDGEITVESENYVFEDVFYDDIEDFMQAMIGSLPERAHKFQKDGNRFIFNVFDCIYFEKSPKGEPPLLAFDYSATDMELTKDQITQVEGRYGEYLRTSCNLGYGTSKKLYAYLYNLMTTSPKDDIRRFPFSKRREVRNKLVDFLSTRGVPIVTVEGEDEDKLGYLDTVLGNKCEGIILKNIHAPYMACLKSSRTHRANMKVKQSITQLLASMDSEPDFDVFITGINKPKSKSITDMIGSLKCSVYINEDGKSYEHEIASVSGIPHEWKRELCAFDKDGAMILNPEYNGKVISINGMALTHKLKFQHATLFHKGDLVFKDKNPTDCCWDKETLEKMIITRGR